MDLDVALSKAGRYNVQIIRSSAPESSLFTQQKHLACNTNPKKQPRTAACYVSKRCGYPDLRKHRVNAQPATSVPERN